MNRPEPKKPRKPPKKITETYLHNAGLYYLERFSASTAQFRRVMMRKVDTSCRAHADQDRAACAVMVETLITTFVRSGLLNDASFTAGKVASLRRRGEAGRAITARLSAKGIAAEMISDALATVRAEEGIDDFQAAVRFARRRRLGPFGAVNAERDKALAAFGRAGFAYDVAGRVMKMTVEEAEEILREDIANANR